MPGSLVKEIQNFPRHLSIHSGGFTLSAHTLSEIVPIEPARMEGRSIVQWDKYDLDTLGLLKVDLLSLGMLSVIRKTLGMTGYKDMAEIPVEDPKTYQMIQRGDTVGVFQIESRAQINMLGRLQPKTFYDLVVEVAIVRPGPIVGQMVHPYLKRRKGLEPVDYPHPALKSILSRTLGVPLFQEQVMKMAVAIGGFSPGEADELRRAIAAWRSQGEIDVLGRKLMQGLLKSGLSQEYVERIFQQIRGFSEYGFPESHAASFALLAYVSSYQKCHFPAEFTCSLINSQPVGFYANHTLVDHAKRQGVEVLPVNPNASQWDCYVQTSQQGKKQLQLGFRVVRGLSKKEVERIVEARQREGAFSSLVDFLARGSVSRRNLQSLALGNAFQALEPRLDRRHLLWQILAYEWQPHRKKEYEQLQLFSQVELPSPDRKLFPSLGAFASVQADYRAYGLSTSAHPMAPLRAEFKDRLKTNLSARRSFAFLRYNSASVRKAPSGRYLSLAGLVIIRQRPQTAKGVRFATLEDEWGYLDLILHLQTYERYQDIFDHKAFLVAAGTLQRDQHSASLLVKRLSPLLSETEELSCQSRDYR